MARDLAIVFVVLFFLLFLFGFVIGTSQFLGQLVAWGLAAVSLIVAIIAGARAVLVDRLMPKR